MIVQPTATLLRAPCEPQPRTDAVSGGFLQAFLSDNAGSDPVHPPEPDDDLDAAQAEATVPSVCPEVTPPLPPPSVLDAARSMPPALEELGGPARSGSAVLLTGDQQIPAIVDPGHAVTPDLGSFSMEMPVDGSVGTMAQSQSTNAGSLAPTFGDSAMMVPDGSPLDPPAALSTTPIPPVATMPGSQSSRVVEMPSTLTVQPIADEDPTARHDPDARPTAGPVARPVAEQIWAMQGLLPTPPVLPAITHPKLDGDARHEPSPGVSDDPGYLSHEVPTTLPVTAGAARIMLLASEMVPVSPIPADDPEANTSANPTFASITVAESADGLIRLSQAIPVTQSAIGPALVVIAANPPQGTVTLTLAPDDLGSLHVRMTQGEGGLHVTLSADRPETLDLMRRHAGELAEELRQAGFASSTFSFKQGGNAGGAGTSQSRPAGAKSLVGLLRMPSVPEPSRFPQPPIDRSMTGAGLDLRL